MTASTYQHITADRVAEIRRSSEAAVIHELCDAIDRLKCDLRMPMKHERRLRKRMDWLQARDLARTSAGLNPTHDRAEASSLAWVVQHYGRQEAEVNLNRVEYYERQAVEQIMEDALTLLFTANAKFKHKDVPHKEIADRIKSIMDAYGFRHVEIESSVIRPVTPEERSQ